MADLAANVSSKPVNIMMYFHRNLLLYLSIIQLG
jgi:hypothetical protein